MKTEKHTIEGYEFEWDIENGRFIFEKDDAVLFWITSAMKTFFDTIEEISGEESKNLVLETTGFRQGLVVGQYFKKLGVSIEKVSESLPSIYASAGWGIANIHDIDTVNKTVIVHLKDDWEYKINIAQGKSEGGSFLPAHYAGVFTGLFNENIWFTITKQQTEENNGFTEVKYSPSNITVNENIHQLTRKREADQINKLEMLVEEKTKELQDLVKALSSPMIPVLDGIVVVPLLGKYDEDRSEELTSKILTNLPTFKANYLLLDLTGLDQEITPYTAALIDRLGHASSLIGTETILVGITPTLSINISKSTINLSRFDCFQTLQHGVYYALAQSGRKIVK